MGRIIVGLGLGVFVGVTVTVGVGVLVGVFVGVIVGVLVGSGCIFRYCTSLIPSARPHPKIESFPDDPKSIDDTYSEFFNVDGLVDGVALHTSPNNAAMCGAAALVP